MRMKKILILAVAATALVACAKSFDKSTSQELTIGFNTWAEHMTKAASNTVGNTFANGDNFNVYGYKTLSGTATDVFTGDVVSTTDGTNWSYTNTRYWDKNASEYGFFAVSPAEKVATATTTAKDGAFVTSDIQFLGNDNDILVANKKTVTTIPQTTAVPLEFNHVASLVDINVKKSPALANATVTISAFSLSNIEDDGVLTVTASNYDPSGAISVARSDWGADDGTLKTYLPANGTTPVYGADNSTAISTTNKITIDKDPDFDIDDPATPGGSTPLFTGLIVKPQAFDGTKNPDASQKITLTYQITSAGGDVNEYSPTLWLVDFDLEDDDEQGPSDQIGSWNPGKHYIFYITIDANAIEFSASINTWTTPDINGYHYLLN